MCCVCKLVYLHAPVLSYVSNRIIQQLKWSCSPSSCSCTKSPLFRLHIFLAKLTYLWSCKEKKTPAVHFGHLANYRNNFLIGLQSGPALSQFPYSKFNADDKLRDCSGTTYDNTTHMPILSFKCCPVRKPMQSMPTPQNDCWLVKILRTEATNSTLNLISGQAAPTSFSWAH